MNYAAFLNIPDWLREIIHDPFHRYLFLGLILLGIGLTCLEYQSGRQLTPHQQQIAFFFPPQCPHCREQKLFIPYLQAKYPELSWVQYDTSLPENIRLLHEFIAKSGHLIATIGVPMTFIRGGSGNLDKPLSGKSATTNTQRWAQHGAENGKRNETETFSGIQSKSCPSSDSGRQDVG